MRRSVAAGACGLCLVLAGPAAAQDMAGQVRGLVFATRDLQFTVLDLGGAVASLAVKETETEIRIELAADVLFDFDKADLRSEAQDALAQVGEIIRAHPDRQVRIEGHTDSKGKESYNQRLSERRAASVRDWLVGVEGLQQTRFLVAGFGESRPAAPNEKPDGSDDPDGRQQNRRVEIVVMKQ